MTVVLTGQPGSDLKPKFLRCTVAPGTDILHLYYTILYCTVLYYTCTVLCAEPVLHLYSSGSTLASCGEDKSIRLWQKEGQSWVCTTVLTEGHTRYPPAPVPAPALKLPSLYFLRTVRWVSWSPCGKLLVWCSTV